MALFTTKTEMATLQSTLAQMWNIAKTSFQSTIPSVSTGVWGATYNATTKMVDARNEVSNNSNFHNQTSSGSVTMTVASGSTSVTLSTATSLYAGDILTPVTSTAYTGTIAITGLSTTAHYVSTGFGTTVTAQTFTIGNIGQPAHFDAAVTLEQSMRAAEKLMVTIPSSNLKSVSTALNTFFNSLASMTFKAYWDPLRSTQTVGNGMTNIDWDDNFRDFWASTQSQDLVCRIGYWVSNGTAYTSYSTAAPDANKTLTVGNIIRLKVRTTGTTTINSYTLTTVSGSSQNKTTPSGSISVGAGTTVITLENGTANFVALTGLGASSSTIGDVIEVWNG